MRSLLAKKEKMIKVNPGKPRPLKYVNCVVISAKFMHGDADSYTFEEMVAHTNNASELAILNAVWKAYGSRADYYGRKELPAKVVLKVGDRTFTDPPNGQSVYDDEYYPGDNEDMELDTDMGIHADLSRMFPWDEQQASIDMYENRARLEKYDITYYDSAGQPFHVTLTETE